MGGAIDGLLIDETEILDVDNRWLTQNPDWIPTVTNAKFSWESYGGATNTLWYDDIAIASSRIGCEE